MHSLKVGSKMIPRNKKGSYFTKLLLNIIHNFIPYVTIVSDNRDLPWIYKEIKELMVEKNKTYKSYCRFNRNTILFEKIKVVQNQLNILMGDFISKDSTLNC